MRVIDKWWLIYYGNRKFARAIEGCAIYSSFIHSSPAHSPINTPKANVFEIDRQKGEREIESVARESNQQPFKHNL